MAGTGQTAVISTALNALLEPALTLLYPPRCFVCRQLGEEHLLCAACADAILPVPEPWCSRCGHPIAEAGRCFHCRHRATAFVHSRSLGAYSGVLREAIHRFKYHDRPKLAEPLGVLLAEFAKRQASDLCGLRFDAVIPIPMNPARRRRRGYNQAERLAIVTARELRLTLEPSWLARSRSTHPQVGLSAERRRANLTKAFSVPAASSVTDKTLLLIDDVTTTGSTLHECASTLKAAGAKAVYALTLAAG